MTDADARALSRLLTLYGPQPLLTRIGQALRSFSEQDLKRWGNEAYRVKCAIAAYYHPSKVAAVIQPKNRSHNPRKG